MKEIEIILRKLILKIILFFKSTRQKRNPVLKSKPRILVIRLNRIGDALVTTPLLKVLKEQLNAYVTVLADRKNDFVFEKCSGVDEIIPLYKGTKQIRETIKNLNESKFDLVIDLHDDVSTTVSYILSKLNAENIIGLDKGKDISKLYTATVSKPDSKKFHVIERNLKILDLLNISPDLDRINIDYNISKEIQEKSSEFLSETFPYDRFLLGINISAGNAARFWGIENFIDLIKNIDISRYNVLLLCSPGDETVAKKISEDKIPLFFTPKFEEFAGMISKLDLLFTPDTSVVHLASASEIPVFGLYVKYNTEDIIWYPYKSKYEVVITEEENLDNVKFTEVSSKFIPFLEREYNAKRNT